MKVSLLESFRYDGSLGCRRNPAQIIYENQLAMFVCMYVCMDACMHACMDVCMY